MVYVLKAEIAAFINWIRFKYKKKKPRVEEIRMGSLLQNAQNDEEF